MPLKRLASPADLLRPSTVCVSSSGEQNDEEGDSSCGVSVVLDILGAKLLAEGGGGPSEGSSSSNHHHHGFHLELAAFVLSPVGMRLLMS
jgi:hypothetical protein